MVEWEKKKIMIFGNTGLIQIRKKHHGYSYVILETLPTLITLLLQYIPHQVKFKPSPTLFYMPKFEILSPNSLD